VADLFLSYAREDVECAEALARALKARGWDVWWDRRILPGQTFADVIERELAQAGCVIVLWSRHSIASRWVKTEAEEAAEQNRLVPVRIEDVRPPFEFRRLQTADFFNWQGGFGGHDFEACMSSIEQLVRSTVAIDMRRFASKPAPPPVPPPPPQQAYRPPTQPVPPVQTAPHPVYAPPQAPPRYPTAGVPAASINTFLLPAILVTFCCIPFGIPAIVYAAQVKSKLNAGDTAGAMQASQKAKRWCLIALGVGVGWAVLYALMMMMAASSN
jgi:hypothetical protein